MTEPVRYAVLGQVFSPFELVGLATMALVCGLAWWRGGRTERRVAIVVALAWVASLLLDSDGDHGVQWRIFAIDALLLSWLIGECLFSRRWWTAVAAAGQTMIVMTHVAFAIDTDIVANAFFSAYYVWSYVVLASLVAGVLMPKRLPEAPSIRAEADNRQRR